MYYLPIERLLFAFTLIQVANGNCRFPQFLQAAEGNKDIRTWITRTEYIKKTEAWKSQHRVEVQEGMISTVLCHYTRCSRAHDDSQKCLLEKLIHRRYCLRREGLNKFVVMHKEEGALEREKNYMCMQFIQHNANVVQVKIGIRSSTDTQDICQEHQFRGMENGWPWIAPKQVEWSFCPISGGFNFRSFENDGTQRRRRVNGARKICPREWRPSRLESECITGEGMTIEFPATNCNPFESGLVKKLQCWASWEEKGFIFIILADYGKHPRYVMRLPVDATKRQFDAQLFFKVTTPTNTKVDSSVTRVMFRLKQNADGFCHDDSPECPNFKRQGKCVRNPPEEYSNYCKLSCGICQLIKPSMREECDFSSDVWNREWLLFTGNKQEEVITRKGSIVFNKMGRFYCKTKHWADQFYKMVSLHTNGCRPRFSCMRLSAYQDIAEFQFSQSSLDNTPLLKLCDFSYTQTIRGINYRNVFRRTLMPKPKIRHNTCDLNGLIFVTTNGKSSDSLKGTLTDYNKRSCERLARLSLTLNATNGRFYTKGEYVCHSLLQRRGSVRLLITADVQMAGKFQCWIIKRPKNGGLSDWSQIYVMPNANCGHEFRGKAIIEREPTLILDMENKRPEKPCGYNPVINPEEMTSVRPQVRDETFSIKATNITRSHVNVRSDNGDFMGRSTSDGAFTLVSSTWITLTTTFTCVYVQITLIT